MKHTHFLQTAVLLLALSATSHAQSFSTIKRQVEAPLSFDGREMKGPHDSLTKEELVRLFNENKVTIGHSAMQIIGISLCLLPYKKDLVGPYYIDTRLAPGSPSADTMPTHQKIAVFIKTNLTRAHRGDKVFIETFCTPAAGGAPCKLKLPTVLVLK